MEKPKRGRPKKFVDLELVEKLAHIQCTYPEIASTLGVSVDTLLRNKDFATTYKRGAEGGRKCRSFLGPSDIAAEASMGQFPKK